MSLSEPPSASASETTSADGADAHPHTHAVTHAHERSRERALVERVRTGDVEAFAAVIAEYIRPVTRVAYWWVHSHDMAEDVAQSVFVRVWEHRHALDPNRPLKPYLLRAVRNVAVDAQRSESARARREDRVAAAEGREQASVPSPEDGILAAATVDAALEQLPERRQLVLRLWLKEELGLSDIADVLGVSLAAADRLLRRAQADLRRIVDVSA
jgi:RNA polymerase sigma-70 factor (ECF subfamily)